MGRLSVVAVALGGGSSFLFQSGFPSRGRGRSVLCVARRLRRRACVAGGCLGKLPVMAVCHQAARRLRRRSVLWPTGRLRRQLCAVSGIPSWVSVSVLTRWRAALRLGTKAVLWAARCPRRQSCVAGGYLGMLSVAVTVEERVRIVCRPGGRRFHGARTGVPGAGVGGELEEVEVAGLPRGGSG